MDPARPYYPQSSGAAQMTGSQPIAPAASASGSAAPREPDYQQAMRWITQANLERLTQATSWRPEWIQSLIYWRAHHDPDHNKRQLPFEKCEQKMSEQFRGDTNLTSESLRYIWGQYIRAMLPQDFRPVHRLGVEAGAPAQGAQEQAQSHPHAHRRPQRSYQSVHALSFGTSQPGAGPSSGGSQSSHDGWYGRPEEFGYGGQQGGLQQGYGGQYGPNQQGPHGTPSGRSNYGHGGQSGAFQQGPGVPYPNTQSTNQTPGRTASSDPRSGNPLPGIESFGQRSQMPPPYESSQSMSGPGYNQASGAMASGTQEPMTFYRTFNSRTDRRFRFKPEHKQWLLDEGMYVDGHDTTWEGVRIAFTERFPGTDTANNGPSAGHLQHQFDKMRTQ